MSIWKTHIDINGIDQFCKNTMVDVVGIEFTEIGDNYLKGRMPVDHRTHQPFGIMHGGASCVLAETLASIAANYCVDGSKEYCVGLDINTSHVRMVKSGFVYGTATPVHLGKQTQIWEVRIVDEQDRLISITRLTLFVLQHKI
jgi:1,4-dihydroxy-2-naphthoyl-CoA hydrolase